MWDELFTKKDYKIGQTIRIRFPSNFKIEDRNILMTNTNEVQAKMSLANPDELQVTLQITMSLNNWKALKAQLSSAYPAWKLSQIISFVVERANSTFTAKEVDCFENVPDKGE